MDVLFLTPGNASGIYQDLANDYSAIEPPTWALLLAQSCRSVGFEVGLIDINAEKSDNNSVIQRIRVYNPRLLCFVVYGQNVNSGTVNMGGAASISNFIRESGVTIPIAYIGSYVQALPVKALNDEPSIDIVFTNEGVYALRNLLSQTVINLDGLSDVKGIAWRRNGTVVINPPEKIVPNERMDADLPGYAWDILPFKKRPFDLYKAPLWHAEYDQVKRTPYAAIQTSLGCVFGCDFCMINMLNRDDNEEIGVAANYKGMRHWTPEFIFGEFEKLISLGVETIKITDEMFLLDKNHFIPLCELLRDKGYGNKLRMWAYSRIDTLKNPDFLKLLRDAGIKWLALGIESGDREVRREVSKGKFEEDYIRQVINQVHDAGIEVMANYIFGLPGDTAESMQKTLDLGLELCTFGWNGYPIMALPGSKTYKDALERGIPLPETYEGFSFHSYNTLPLPTNSLTAAEILAFRDEAYEIYHSNPIFLEKINNKFGKLAVENIHAVLKIKLKRKILQPNE